MVEFFAGNAWFIVRDHVIKLTHGVRNSTIGLT